jgi:hypothetical protein
MPNDKVPTKDSLFSTNNSTDSDLENISAKYNRQNIGAGIIGTWKYQYQSTTNEDVTGVTNYEITFKDEGSFSRYSSRYIRRIDRYENSVPVYSWEAVGLPRTDSGKFSLQSIDGIKTINMDVYNYSDGSYMSIYDNKPIYVSETYLFIGDISNSTPYSFEVKNIRNTVTGKECKIFWDNPTDPDFSYVVLYYYKEGNEAGALSKILKDGISNYNFTDINSIDYIKMVAYNKNDSPSTGITYKLKYNDNVKNIDMTLFNHSVLLEWEDPDFANFSHVLISSNKISSPITVQKNIQQYSLPITFIETNDSVSVVITAIDLNGNYSQLKYISNHEKYFFDLELDDYVNFFGTIGLYVDEAGKYTNRFPIKITTKMTSWGSPIPTGVTHSITQIDGALISQDGKIIINESINFSGDSITIYAQADYKDITYKLPIIIKKYSLP